MALGELSIPVNRVSLGASLFVPADAPGLVVFAHGSGSSRLSPRNQYVARVLRDAGLGILLFDLMTAEEERAEAHTRHLRFNIPFLAERLVGVTRWALEHTGSRALNIGYFGSSTGAAAALVAAAEIGELAADALERVKAPTLLIVGGEDKEVITLNEKACEKLRCEKVLRIIPGASHLFEEPGTLEIVSGIASEWFKQHWAQKVPS
jgi:putative phosphoribosyl transferase